MFSLVLGLVVDTVMARMLTRAVLEMELGKLNELYVDCWSTYMFAGWTLNIPVNVGSIGRSGSPLRIGKTNSPQSPKLSAPGILRVKMMAL